MENTEIWKDVEGYNGKYIVSNLGNVKSFYFLNPKNLKQNTTGRNRDYLIVSLCKNNISKNYLIHRLVADAFIPNPKNKPQVNHKDGNKSNNNAENLEWNTCSENQLHAVSIGTKGTLIGEQCSMAILTEKDVLDIRKSTLTQKQLGVVYGVARTTIQAVKNRKNWKHI